MLLQDNDGHNTGSVRRVSSHRTRKQYRIARKTHPARVVGAAVAVEGSTRSKRDIATGTSHIIKARHNSMPLTRTCVPFVLASRIMAKWQIPTRRVP